MATDALPRTRPADDPARAQAHRSPPDRLAGAAAVVTAIVFTVAFALLGVTFDYPAVLDRSAGEILDAYRAAGTATYVLWYVMVASSLAFIPVAVLIRRSLAARHPRAGTLLDLTATAGVLAGLVQAVGFARWSFAVPYLADVSDGADAATAAAVTVVFETLHRFVGGALGEHLGFGLTALWAIGTSIVLLHDRAFPRALPLVGLLSGAAVGAGTLEAAGVAAAGLIVAAGYTVFAAWLAWLGVVLILRPDRVRDGRY